MRNSCRSCESSTLDQILDFGPLPLAGGFLDGPDAARREQKYPLAIHVCRKCGLVQVLDPIAPDILFQDYSFSSSTIKPLVDHFEAYAGWLAQQLQPRTVVEFGCNDGVLLDPLERRGITAIGVDISKNITDMARAKGLKVIAGFFNKDVARQITDRYGPVDLVTGSNAFAHNDHPELILEAATACLGDNGHLCLEFMYAGDLLEQLQWDTLYHEHLTFYSLATVSTLLERYGFHVTEAFRIPMHGGSLRVVASRKPATAGKSMEAVAAYERQTKLNDAETWRGFAERSRRKIEIVADVFANLSRSRSIWAYGAAGKATMWVNAARMDYLGAVVDASPLRAGKLMPGTHTRIVFPEEFRAQSPDHMFVTAWNYADHIRAKEGWFKGTWSTPLPDLRFF